MDKKVIMALASLKSSEYRHRIADSIGNETLMPSEIAEKTGLRLNHVSAFLKELKQIGIVQCLNEENRKGRLYQLTTIGKSALQKIEDGKPKQNKR